MGSVEKHGKGLLNEGAFSHKHLRWRLQCFALAVAMLCVGDCNALCEFFWFYLYLVMSCYDLYLL